MVDLFDTTAWDEAGLGAGDLVHLETPVNPTGCSFSIREFAEKAHARGAYLSVDSTFGPPGLQRPFSLGADIIHHSGTKYIGGHSDLLLGVLVTRNDTKGQDQIKELFTERQYLGSTPGNLETWLGFRSLKTLQVRLRQQSRTAEELVRWLQVEGKDGDRDLISRVVSHCEHSSLQADESGWLKEQMPEGFGSVFALYAKSPEMAGRIAASLNLFVHATSLGEVESLIEWRKISDSLVDPRLLRVSIGLEHIDDLKEDFRQAFRSIAESTS
ncbi:Cys/Met metabolism PLP-dependent enzyme-like protein 3 [Elsinoe fawcettii]|nr:Cys/Met metabolism PLP-dependent enzyme-like protein 3 [Elsinoe fawcettii]